jgi:hypothetical protein
MQQRIRHDYRRQRPTPLPSRTAQSRHQSQLGVDGLDVTRARSIWLRVAGSTSPFLSCSSFAGQGKPREGPLTTRNNGRQIEPRHIHHSTEPLEEIEHVVTPALRMASRRAMWSFIRAGTTLGPSGSDPRDAHAWCQVTGWRNRSKSRALGPGLPGRQNKRRSRRAPICCSRRSTGIADG